MSEQMQAGAELDVALGRQLFKLEVDWEGEEDKHPLFRNGKIGWRELPKYSTDWNSMRLVVEALAEDDMFVEIRKFKNSVSCIIRNDMGGIVAGVHKIKTEPHAVCLAALKALEADTHE